LLFTAKYITIRSMKPAVGVMLALACAFTSASCRGILTWATVYESVAPDGGTTLQVQVSKCFGDCDVRVVVNRGWSAERIAARSDCAVQFAHAEWEGDTVAVFVDGSSCGPIKAAYDARARRAVEFAAVEPWLRDSITRSYGVTADELSANQWDVFQWATYPGDGQARRSTEEFSRRFPLP
jgi:hypothetical protein